MCLSGTWFLIAEIGTLFKERFTFLNPDLLLKLDTASDLGVIINDLSNARNKLFTSLQRGGWQIYLIVCGGEDGRFIF